MALEKELHLQEYTSFDEGLDKQYIISPMKFMVMHTFSFGLYSTWWAYKVWRFFIQREHSNSNAALRVVLGIFYFIPLCYRILRLAKSKGYQCNYFPVLLFLFFLLTTVFGAMPPPMFFIWLFSGLFLLQPVMAFNFILSQSPEVSVAADGKLTITEIFIVVLGGLTWFLIILGTLAMIFLQTNPD